MALVGHRDPAPIIEYSAPRLLASRARLECTNFISIKQVEFYRVLAEGLPLDQDPYLAGLTPRQLGYVEAGRFFFIGTCSWI